jgi:hypothetical protein
MENHALRGRKPEEKQRATGYDAKVIRRRHIRSVTAAIQVSHRQQPENRCDDGAHFDDQARSLRMGLTAISGTGSTSKKKNAGERGVLRAPRPQLYSTQHRTCAATTNGDAAGWKPEIDDED